MFKIKSLLLSIIFLFLSCSNYEPNKHNYHEIKDYNINWSDIFIQDDDDYLVYFYSERCGHCNEIKQDVISFSLEDIFPLYFICTDIEVIIGPTKDLIGVDSIDDFYIFGTPFLIRIYQHAIASYYVGSNEVKDYISILKNNY